MRTVTLSPLTQAITRLRGQTRRLASHASATPGRWVLGLSAVTVVGVLLYTVSGTPLPAGAFVRSGTRFSDDDVLVISHALYAKHVPFRPVDDGRIEVSADRLDDANDVIAKLAVGPRPLVEIEKKQAENWSILDTPDDKLERTERGQAELIAGFIMRLEGITSARVLVNRPKGRDLRRTAPTARPFVWLETQGKRELSHKLVESIQQILVGTLPEVKPNAITIIDQTGHSYLDAGNPSLGALSRKHAREEELRDEIAKKLDWLKGVQVAVQLVPAPESRPVAAPTPSRPPEPPPALPAEDLRLPEPPKMSMNQPIDSPPDEVPRARASTPLPEPSPPPASKPLPIAPPDPSTDDDETARSMARVLVTVPRSFYLGRMPGREPSLDDLQAFVLRTETNVEKAVSIVVPPGQLKDVNVITIPDALPPTSPPPAANMDVRRSLSWWIPIGIATGATAVALALAFRLLAVRRPPARTADRDRADRGRYKIDEADAAPGPSERVRELIRQNPEAAASVLHRWTGQGGPIG